MKYIESRYEENPAYCGYGRGKDQRESYADTFAGNFLVPGNELIKTIRIIKEMQKEAQLLWILKGHFMVSYRTILYRLKEIGYLNAAQFNYIFSALRKRYGNTEPFPLTTDLTFTQEEELIADVKNIQKYVDSADELSIDPVESYPKIDTFLESVSQTYVMSEESVSRKFSLSEVMN